MAIEGDITNMVFFYAIMAIRCAKIGSSHAKAEINVKSNEAHIENENTSSANEGYGNIYTHRLELR